MILPNDLKLFPIPPCKDNIELAMHFGNLFPIASRNTEKSRLGSVLAQALIRKDDLCETAYFSGKQMAIGQVLVMNIDQ